MLVTPWIAEHHTQPAAGTPVPGMAVNLDKVRALVEELHACSCTPGCFTYGCTHQVRRLRARLWAPTYGAVLCRICAEELGVQLKSAEVADRRCSCCASWHAHEVLSWPA